MGDTAGVWAGRFWSGEGLALRRGAWWLSVPVAAAGIVLLGRAALYFSTPGASYAAWWPASGVALAFFLLTPRKRLAVAAVTVFAATVVANAMADQGIGLSLWYGVADVIEAAVATAILTSGWRGEAQLETLEDTGRLLVASLAGSLSLGVLGSLGIVAMTDGSFWTSVGSLTASHMAAQVIIVPIVLAARGQPTVTGRRIESGAQFVLLLGAALLCYLDAQGRPLMFLPLVTLLWGVLRLGMRLVAFELLVLGVIMVLGTNAGRGPFGAAEALSGAHATLFLQGAILAHAVITIPLTAASRQRRRAMSEVSSSRDLLQSVLDATQGVAVVAADTEGRIVVWSNGAEKLFGYSREEALGGLRVPQIYDTGGGEPMDFREATRPLWEGLPLIEGDRRYLRKDGSTFTGHLRLSRRVDALGRVLGYMGVVEDVEESRRAEAALRAALEREEEAVDRMAALDRSKNDFIASVSHELRTPITSVIGYTDLLAARDLPEAERSMLDRVRRNARRLELLIEDLLTVSRMESGTFVYRPSPMDLAECVRGAGEAAERLCSGRVLDLVVEVPAASVAMVGDEAQLERALANVLSNAIKFTPDGGRIELRLDVEGDKAVITVSDTGVGIPAAEQPRIFELFYRASQAAADAVAGTGLGLHILNEVVKAHGGTVTLDSVEGRGTTFLITLPLQA